MRGNEKINRETGEKLYTVLIWKLKMLNVSAFFFFFSFYTVMFNVETGCVCVCVFVSSVNIDGLYSMCLLL